jgi:hypothetical protein
LNRDLSVIQLDVESYLYMRLTSALHPLQATMGELQQHDPEAAASLKRLQQQHMSKQQLQELLLLDGVPSSCSTKEQYVQYSCEQLLGVGEGGWAVEAVQKGFWSAVDKEVSGWGLGFGGLGLLHGGGTMWNLNKN